MTLAANLTEAAFLSYDQCGILWNAGTLRTHYTAFCAAASPIFSDQETNDRPVGNWLIPMYALLTQVPTETPESQRFLDTSVQYLYRICYAGYVMRTQGLISVAKANALLAAWNAQIGS